MKSGSFDLEFVRRMMAAIERAMHELGRSPGLELPVMDEITKNFRHQSKDDQQLVFLKGVRYVSMLNAYLVLFAHGFMQEMGVLSRCMDETLQDAMFFVLRTGEDGQLSDRQAMAMHEFYQEEFEDLSVGMLRNNERKRVPRRSIRAAIAAMPENEVNRHDAAHIFGAISDTYSGYVHGAYPHIMELYGGWPPHYHTRGMRSTPRQSSAENELVTYAYRGILIAQMAATKLRRQDILDRLLQIRGTMEARHPHLAQDPLESLEALKRKR